MGILDDIRAAQTTDAALGQAILDKAIETDATVEAMLDELKALRDQVQQFLTDGVTQEAGQEILNSINASIAKKEEALAAVGRISTDE